MDHLGGLLARGRGLASAGLPWPGSQPLLACPPPRHLQRPYLARESPGGCRMRAGGWVYWGPYRHRSRAAARQPASQPRGSGQGYSGTYAGRSPPAASPYKLLPQRPAGWPTCLPTRPRAAPGPTAPRRLWLAGAQGGV